MAQSAFIVKVPGAESLVRGLRERFDATAKLGVPAHITVLFPFMDPGDIAPKVLQKAQRALKKTHAFSFELNSVGKFPATAYLAPVPSAPFIALTRAIAGAFPGFQPYAGEHHGVVPHLTVAHGSSAEAEEAAELLQQRLDHGAPATGQCDSVTLIEDSTGRWRDLHVFHLSSYTSEPRK